MELDRHQAFRGGEPLELTVKEFDLLRLLLENAGKVVRREQLIRDVWDTTWYGSTKTLDVHVSALRRKLGDDPSDPRYIHTVRGVGFRFASADELSPMSFRTRLLLGAFYVLTAVVLALEIPLALTVERRADSDFEAVVLGDAAILAARVSDLVGAPGGAPRLRELVAESAQAHGRSGSSSRTPRGRVVADSDGEAPRGVFYATSRAAGAPRGALPRPHRHPPALQRDARRGPPARDRAGRRRRARRRSRPLLGEHGRDRRGRAIELDSSCALWARRDRRGARPHVAPRGAARPPDPAARGRVDAAREAASSTCGRPRKGRPSSTRSRARSTRWPSELTGSIESQREFVANASHQLRTPLTGIRLRLEAIAQEGGRAGEQAAKAQAELDRLSALVDDLLALAHASSSDATATTVDLGELAREAVARWREGAEAAGKRLELRADGRPVVWASPRGRRRTCSTT